MEQENKQNTSEAELLALLATLRVESTPEANFEERFLYDFHERVVRETVCCPAHRRVWEHVMQILTNFGRRRLVYGASTLGVGVLAVGGYMVVPETEDQQSNPRVMVAKRFDNTVSSLVPGLSRDYSSCTSVRVVPKSEPFDRENVLVNRDSSSDRTNMYTSCMRNDTSLWELSPLNVGESYETGAVFSF
ncbi:MAG: hypothetical protein IJE66_02290 [Akkermansia sp.]|nr:hypothetical protein [Akkermansia sp.]